jgi:peptidoglycan-N-acetylglucosamine deacetylase
VHPTKARAYANIRRYFWRPATRRRHQRAGHHQKEGQVETPLRPEVTAAGCGFREREVVRSSEIGSGSSRVFRGTALTFDDGPDPLWTPRVLEALGQAGVQATFFVIAPLALEHPRIVSAILQAGQRVEFHCTEHVRHTRRSRREVEVDTREGLAVLRSLGVEPRLWRPPWGVLAPWTESIAEEFGLRLAPWSVDTHDWRGDKAPEMLHRTEPLLGPGSIVLMHDGLGPGAGRVGCEETVALVELLVARLRSLGCEPEPLTLLPTTRMAVERQEARE